MRVRPPRGYCPSCALLERGTRVAPGERVARRTRWGWACPRCGGAVRLLDGWLARSWRLVWRCLFWGTALAAIVYTTKP